VDRFRLVIQLSLGVLANSVGSQNSNILECPKAFIRKMGGQVCMALFLLYKCNKSRH
jgi:hypothetical protein